MMTINELVIIGMEAFFRGEEPKEAMAKAMNVAASKISGEANGEN